MTSLALSFNRSGEQQLQKLYSTLNEINKLLKPRFFGFMNEKLMEDPNE